MANPTTSSKGNEARTNAGQALDKAKEAAGNVADVARDVASQAVDKAKDAASSVGGMVSDTAKNVGRKADDLTSQAGTGIKNFGDTIREHAPQGGLLGDAAKTVASTTKQVGSYLEEEGLSGMFEDMTNLIKRNPIPAILVGVGLGVLIGRVMKS
jgi:ElaB/YqjD/DUF883 family membrane-anchored ribosome-binding protein